jgi:hypothetical protein
MFIKKNMHFFSKHVFDHSYSTRNKNSFKLITHKSTNFNKSIKKYLINQAYCSVGELLNEKCDFKMFVCDLPLCG